MVLGGFYSTPSLILPLREGEREPENIYFPQRESSYIRPPAKP